MQVFKVKFSVFGWLSADKCSKRADKWQAAKRYTPTPSTAPLIDHYFIDYGMEGVEVGATECFPDI
jgi:hypothetical protein